MAANGNGLLEKVRVATPCHVDWDEMRGDARQRFCGQCQLNVYNLSEMTRDEAERFVRQAEGRVCIRMYRRPDGTVITQDCPVGLAARARRAMRTVWRRMAAAAVLAVSLVAGGLGCERMPASGTDGGSGSATNGASNTASGTGSSTGSGTTETGTGNQPIERPEVVMGDICPPEDMPEPLPNPDQREDDNGPSHQQ